MKPASSQTIYIDPSYAAFYGGKLFDLSDPVLNRDDQLLALARLKAAAASQGVNLQTADQLTNEGLEQGADYYSLGLIANLDKLERLNVRARAYVLMEPPVVAPKLYQKLAELSHRFERVYVHNTHGDGYSAEGVNLERLRKLYWPLPYRGVLDELWGKQNRSSKIVAINGHHKPADGGGELYSRRIHAIAALSKSEAIDLYGNGWNDWFSRRGMWPPYLLNHRAISSVYRGPCKSKYETLSQYSFCLCFENMSMNSYMTEKIFDCLYTGTIPLYIGAPDIATFVDAEAFIDCRQFERWADMLEFVKSVSPAKIDRMRDAGRAFMESERMLPYFNAFEDIVFGE